MSETTQERADRTNPYLLTRCNWCEAGQEGNLSDTCASCNREGYLMDYKEESK